MCRTRRPPGERIAALPEDDPPTGKAMQGLRERIEQRSGADVWSIAASDRIAPSLDVPGLVIHDLQDRQIALDEARQLVAAWPGAELVVTSGLGHLRVLRDCAVVQRVVEFLAAAATTRRVGPQPETPRSRRRPDALAIPVDSDAGKRHG